MYEEKLLTPRIQMKFILLQRFLDKYSGPFNTALLYARVALMESFAYYVQTTTTRFGRPYRSGAADVPWFSKSEVYPEAKADVYWYLHIDPESDKENERQKAIALA